LQGGEDYDFVGILYGDVTGNWAPPALLASATGASKEAPFVDIDPSVGNTFTAVASTGATLTLASAPHQNADGTWEIVLGLQHADEIIGLDMNFRYNASTVHVLDVATT